MKDQAIEQLGLISKNEAKYSKLLTSLIAQALFRLVEKEVYLKCREKDLALVQVTNLNLYAKTFILNINNYKKRQLLVMQLLYIKMPLNAKLSSKYCQPI